MALMPIWPRRWAGLLVGIGLALIVVSVVEAVRSHQGGNDVLMAAWIALVVVILGWIGFGLHSAFSQPPPED
jgi:hypothetical protein